MLAQDNGGKLVECAQGLHLAEVGELERNGATERVVTYVDVRPHKRAITKRRLVLCVVANSPGQWPFA